MLGSTHAREICLLSNKEILDIVDEMNPIKNHAKLLCSRKSMIWKRSSPVPILFLQKLVFLASSSNLFLIL